MHVLTPTERPHPLTERFDAVVMLTWSNWQHEPRSNRYHYARRFGEHLPVVFVQPDLDRATYRYEPTELENVSILHLSAEYGRPQTLLLHQALRERGVFRPLLWIYNYLFLDAVRSCFAPLKAYHATEDYFSHEFSTMPDLDGLRDVLASCDLLVAVSPGVLDDYLVQGRFQGASLLATNGCDFRFWSEPVKPRPENGLEPQRKVALYQGGINYRVDFELLCALADRLPDWEFRLCGQDAYVLNGEDAPASWQDLRERSNVNYFGMLDIETMKEHMVAATVGLVPYVLSDVINKSFPLKIFEYTACGLPVVTTPIPALRQFEDLLFLADGTEEFTRQIEAAGRTRYDARHLAARTEAARGQDYDRKFESVCAAIESTRRRPRGAGERLNVLVLYDTRSVHVNTIREHLESFSLYSQHRFWFANATADARCPLDLAEFDAVIVHYCVRLSLQEHLSESYAEALRRYPGLKILFIQDEYDTTNIACEWIVDLGIQLVFTCVPLESVGRVYDAERFRHVRFVETLTGYVPERLLHLPFAKPLGQREFLIGYRGRRLPYWYGKLGQEKYEIGMRMREVCAERGLPVDIECDDSRRIYGDKWYEFLGNCRATLGTESGSNVFDWDGSLHEAITDAIRERPDLTFEEAFEQFLTDREGEVVMNQISPKIFEAIALRTVLVLYEGTYSGVLERDEHYIPLCKDFSNVDEVLAKLADDDLVATLTARAYDDVVASGRHGFEAFVRDFDRVLAEEVGTGTGSRLVSVLIGTDLGDRTRSVVRLEPGENMLPQDTASAAPYLLTRPRPLFPIPVEATEPGLLHPLGPVREAGRRMLPLPARRLLKPPLKMVVNSRRAIAALRPSRPGQ